MKINCGIYQIKNVINGNCYIGQSVSLKKRKYVHFYWLELVINGGIIMGLLMLFYFTKVFTSLWKLRKNEFSIKLLVALMLFVLASISLSSAHYFLPYYAFLGLLSAWINLNIQHNEKDAIAG
jgi:hypothetical protein